MSSKILRKKYIANYNSGMVDLINIFISSFVLDFSSGVLVKKIFKLSPSFVYLFLLQIFNISTVVVYVFCAIKFYEFLLFKLIANLIICVLVTDSFKFFDVFKLWFFDLIIMFSLYGFSIFITEFFRAVIESGFRQKTAKNINFIIIIGVFLYFVAIFCFFCKLSKQKTFNNYLAKVSFLLYGKHIEITGLLDSGNSLIDLKTNKPVIVISSNSLRKYFMNFDFENVLESGFCCRSIRCESAGGSVFQMPIVSIDNVCVKQGEIKKEIKCMLGIVNQKFYDEKKYDCLIHRDFI